MEIHARHTRDIIVDITPEELSTAILNCGDISLSDMVDLTRKKFLHATAKDDTLFIKDGVWHMPSINSLGKNVVYQGHPATEAEIEILEAIEALDAVMVMDKLKGRQTVDK